MVAEKVNLDQPVNFTHSSSVADLEDFNQVSFSEVHTSIRLKRCFDVCLASVVIILIMPLLILIGIIVKIENPKLPVIFRQQRTGRGGRVFRILKFRTMHCLEDGDDIDHAHRDDHRVTGVGYFLRRSSLDELPQFFNVLGGSMSIIGPRPHAVAHDVTYGALLPAYNRRFNVKPGITGWAQIHGLRGNAEAPGMMSERLRYDLWYIRNRSLRLDILIFLRTFSAVFSNENVH